MMTKEDVTAIEEYCRENNRKRIAELGLCEWKFYHAKRRCSKSKDAKGGGFVQLFPAGDTGHGQCRHGMPAPDIRHTAETVMQPVSIEQWTPDGTAVRVSGSLDSRRIGEIIKSVSSHVQP